jgi:hypothetical protein
MGKKPNQKKSNGLILTSDEQQKIPVKIRKKMHDIYYRKKADSYLASLSYLLKHYGEYSKYWKLFLHENTGYVSTRGTIRKFQRRKYLVSEIGVSFQADICVLLTAFGERLSKHNKGIKYLLVLVDMLSRKIYVYPLTTKSSTSVAKALEHFFKKMNGSVLYLMTDMDGCFYGNTTKTILNKYGVKLYSSKNVEIKSSLVENRIKLLKFSIFNYITQNNTFNYTKDLSEIVETLNNRKHSRLKISPNEVTKYDQSFLFHSLHRNNIKTSHSKLRINEIVRISIPKKTFSKESTRYFWKKELFAINKIVDLNPIMYQISDMENNIIEGMFYEKELIKVVLDLKKHPHKILDKKGNSVFVHFTGYPKQTAKWINLKSLLF